MNILTNEKLSELRAQSLENYQNEHRILSLIHLQNALQRGLDEEVVQFLGREKNRKHHKGRFFQVRYPCPHCQESWSWKFNRCGHYIRKVLSMHGLVRLRVPRILCRSCLRKFGFPSKLLVPRSRLWLDVIAHIHELYGMRASFALIQQFLFRRTKEWLGKFTLMSRIRRMLILPKTGHCPSSMGLDGIHVHGKLVYGHKHASILIATNNDTHDIMDYYWCRGETAHNYDHFVKRLIRNFKLHRSSLKHIVSDGLKGIFWATEGLAQSQTICSFHVLQNIKQNASDHLRAKAIMSEAKHLFRQATYSDALKLFKTIEQRWVAKEPNAIKNLRRSIEKSKAMWFHQEFPKTNNITERRIRDIRRKSKAMDNFRSQKTAEPVLEMIMHQVRNFKRLGNWFAPVQKLIFT